MVSETPSLIASPAFTWTPVTRLSLQTLLFQLVASQMIHRRTEGLDQFKGSLGSRGSDHREPAAAGKLVDEYTRRRQTAQS